MIETLKLKGESLKKIKENDEIPVAVKRETLYSTWNVFTRSIYCHLENKKRKLNNIEIRDRTMSVEQGIDLPLTAFVENVKHNYRRGGTKKIVI